jgi:hypothetical protein
MIQDNSTKLDFLPKKKGKVTNSSDEWRCYHSAEQFITPQNLCQSRLLNFSEKILGSATSLLVFNRECVTRRLPKFIFQPDIHQRDSYYIDTYIYDKENNRQKSEES